MTDQVFAVTSDLRNVVMMARRKINSKKFDNDPVYVEFDDNGDVVTQVNNTTHVIAQAWSVMDGEYVGIILYRDRDDGQLYNMARDNSITLWYPTSSDFEKRIKKLDKQINELQEERDKLEAVQQQVNEG